jgi:hypothetical protein
MSAARCVSAKALMTVRELSGEIGPRLTSFVVLGELRKDFGVRDFNAFTQTTLISGRLKHSELTTPQL